MDNFYGTLSASSHANFTLDENEDTFDNISLKMNRSRQLLNEMVPDSTIAFKQHSVLNERQSPFQAVQQPHQTNKYFTLQSHQTSSSSVQPDSQSSIYTQFKIDTNRFIDENLNLIELLKSYSSICAEHSQFLNEKIQHLKLNRQRQDYLNTVINEQDDLNREKDLWNLIYILYEDEQNTKLSRMIDDDDYVDKENGIEEKMIGINEVLLVEHLERKNPLLRRIKLIIDWLEKIAAESKSFKLVKEKIGEFPQNFSSWEHTLHHLNSTNEFGNKKEKIHFSSREYVDELDPDAPIRQNKSLHDLDQEDEYKLMEYIYSFIRAGQLNSARDFCFKIGQYWRAATLDGFKYFKDQNYLCDLQNKMDTPNHEIYLNEGNLNRDIWRLIVHKLIKDENFSSYEKASYASLAGFVAPVLPVCRTYMDFIWIYFKALHKHIIEREIRQKMSSLREFENIPYDNDEDYIFVGLNKTSSLASLPTMVQIFDRIRILINNSGVSSIAASNLMDKTVSGSSGGGLSISSQVVTNLKIDAQKPFSVVLKHIIMSGLDGFNSGTNELMEYLKTVVTTNPQNGLLLRFSSHLSLLYRSASFQLKDETFIEINENYVQYLVDNNYKEIIAYYLSQLPSDIQIKRYSKFLQTISDNKERQTLLKLAKERNMNVQAITLNIVENISKKSLPSKSDTSKFSDQSLLSSTTAFIDNTTKLFTSNTSQVLSDEDKARVNAIDWIIYDPVQRFKLLEYANMTMRHFLLERQNFDAARLIFSKIPQDTLSAVLSQYNFSSSILGQQANIEANFHQIIENLPTNVTNTIKEYLCFKEYVAAVNIYNEWFEIFNREKPIKPVSKFDLDTAQANQIQSGIDQSNIFAERISYDYQLKQYEDHLARWNSKARVYCDKVKSKFYSLLKFPFGGWMVDINDQSNVDNDNESEDIADTNSMSDDADMISDETDESNDHQSNDKKSTKTNESQLRTNQMKSLRKLYLPNACFVLLDMLGKMNLNKELIRISDLIASENYKLYVLFEAKQLKFFLNKVADASISLLDENNDFLGYN